MLPQFDDAGGLKSHSAKPDSVPGGGLKRSASQERLTRSNSLDNFDMPLAMKDRKRARPGDTLLSKDAMIEFSVIAVYSREAFENFGKEWKKQMDTDSSRRATKSSRAGQDPADIASRLLLLPRKTVTSGFEDQLQALLENKTIPHVVAVIEGKQEQDAFTLRFRVEGKDIGLGYSRKLFVQGQAGSGSKDDKQSMSFYVRDDMKGVYTFSREEVPRGTDKIPAIGVNYKTTDGKSFRSLVVHIPNKFVKPDQMAGTRKAFENYATKLRELPSPVFVTGYLGDTNFKKPAYPDSVPSMGGYLRKGATLNPQSSSAQDETHFMQSIPVGPFRSEYSVMQPATLNSLFLNSDAQNREATDHPSIIHFTAHEKDLNGRDPDVFPSYYRPVDMVV